MSPINRLEIAKNPVWKIICFSKYYNVGPIEEAIGPYDELLSIFKNRKLRWYGHGMRSTGLSKTILQGTVEGTRRRGGQRRRWEDDITKWTGLGPVETMRLTKDRHRWTQLSATSTVVPQRSLCIVKPWKLISIIVSYIIIVQTTYIACNLYEFF